MSSDIVQKINRLIEAGDFAAAQKRIRPLVRKEPRNAGLQNVAGICHARSISNKAALPYFAAATKLAPDNVDFRCNLTLALVMTGAREKAQAQIDRLHRMAPKDGRPHYYAALVCNDEHDSHGVIAHCSRALTLSPDLSDALALRATALTQNLRSQEALEDLNMRVALRPKDTKAHVALATHLAETGQPQAALAEYERVLALDPGHVSALSRVAALCPDAHIPEVARKAEALAQQRPKDARNKAFVALTQAILCNRAGDTKTAMRHFTDMHRIEAKQHPWKTKPGWARYRELTRTFPLNTPLRAEQTQAPRPIFVVGLPRSGTTLVEMMLSSAQGVAACGELPTANVMVQRLLSDRSPPTPASLSHLAAGFRALMPELPDQTRGFVDKMPANYRYLGPLLSAFPQARVVNLRRDPRDVALSMWMRRFPAAGMGFTNHLPWIADQANLYRAYMRHWESAYPEQILSIDYEDLVRDPETTSRRLAQHCKIDWSDAMLRPEENQNTVRTASIFQVREKLHATSIGRWHAFGDQITDLTDHLDPDLWPDDL